jgi:23S rRNA (cytosine1962-C5)-methyltransferase
MRETATVSARGARRWVHGHPWIYRSDVTAPPDVPAGTVLVHDPRGKAIGWALWSPLSEISLRLLDRDPRASIDVEWWRTHLRRAIARRAPLVQRATAYRLVHGEGDGLPSFVCDRYDRWLVVQLMSAGLEASRSDVVAALIELVSPAGIRSGPLPGGASRDGRAGRR